MLDSPSRGYQLRIRHKGKFYLVYANSDCYLRTSFWSAEASCVDFEILGRSLVVMCSGLLSSSASKAVPQGANRFSFRKMLQKQCMKWCTTSTEWKTLMIPFKSEYSFWITVNSLLLYWCLTANVTFSKTKRKEESRTNRSWLFTSAMSRIGNGETKNLNFISNQGSLPILLMSRST